MNPNNFNTAFSIDAELASVCRSLRRTRVKRAVVAAAGQAIWIGAVMSLTSSAGLAIAGERVLGRHRFMLACSVGVIAMGMRIFEALLRSLGRIDSPADAAERIDLAFQTQNRIASSVSLARVLSSPFIESAVAAGRKQLDELLVRDDFDQVLAGTVPATMSNFRLPAFAFVLAILLAALIIRAGGSDGLILSRQGMVIAKAKTVLFIADSGQVPTSPSTENARVSDEKQNTVPSGFNSPAHMNATLPDADGAPTGRGAMLSLSGGPATGRGTPVEQESPSSTAGIGGPPEHDRSQSATDINKSKFANLKKDDDNRLQSLGGMNSGQVDKQGSGEPGGANQKNSPSQTPGSDSDANNNAMSSSNSPKQTEGNGSPQTSTPAQPSPSESTQQKQAQAGGLDSNPPSPPNAQPNAGKPSATPGGMKKSRGVPPLLLGERQADTLNGPLLPGPEEHTSTLAPPQQNPGISPPAAEMDFAEGVAPAVSPFRVEASDESVVADYLIALHDDISHVPSASLRTP